MRLLDLIKTEYAWLCVCTCVGGCISILSIAEEQKKIFCKNYISACLMMPNPAIDLDDTESRIIEFICIIETTTSCILRSLSVLLTVHCWLGDSVYSQCCFCDQTTTKQTTQEKTPHVPPWVNIHGDVDILC